MKRDSHPQLRNRILRAAASLFRERGYRGTSLEAIAQSLGLTAPALYWHFRSKETILYEFLLSTLEQFFAQMHRALAQSPDPVEQLWLFAEAHTRVHVEQFSLSVTYDEITYNTSQLAKSLSRAHYRQLVDLQRQHLDRCRAIIRAGVDKGLFDVPDVNVAALAIVNMCESVNRWYRPTGPLSPDDVATLHADLALRIVGASQSSTADYRQRFCRRDDASTSGQNPAHGYNASASGEPPPAPHRKTRSRLPARHRRDGRGTPR